MDSNIPFIIVLPGQKLCWSCFKECSESKGELDIIRHKITNETKMYFEACIVTNESLRQIVPLWKNVRTDRGLKHGKRKIEEFTKKFCNAAVVALTEPELENDDSDICLSLVKYIKEKFKICNKPLLMMIGQLRKQSIFLMLQNTWLVKIAQKLGKEKGILPVSEGYSREAEEKMKVKVKNVLKEIMWVTYTLWRMIVCLLSLKMEERREYKRDLLSNLKEIYQHFVTENPAVKVEFSTFAMLRPKRCVRGIIWDTQCMCMSISPKCETNV